MAVLRSFREYPKTQEKACKTFNLWCKLMRIRTFSISSIKKKKKAKISLCFSLVSKGVGMLQTTVLSACQTASETPLSTHFHELEELFKKKKKKSFSKTDSLAMPLYYPHLYNWLHWDHKDVRHDNSFWTEIGEAMGRSQETVMRAGCSSLGERIHTIVYRHQTTCHLT